LELDPAPLVWQLIDPVLAAREFSQKVFVIHLKDTEVLKKRLNEVGIIGQGWWRYRLPGFGQIDWPGFFKSLAEGGFQGCMNIEHEDPVYSGREDRIKEGLVKALAFAKKSIG
jgi:sugar phosphate isomerase/epimerase